MVIVILLFVFISSYIALAWTFGIIPIKRKKVDPAAPCQVYEEITELPMSVFVKCSLTGNLNLLLKTGGFAPDEVLTSAWNNIKGQYHDAQKDAEQTHILGLVTQIDYLSNKLKIVKGIVDHLAVRRHEGLIKLLQTELHFPFAYVDLETDLEKTVTKAKFDLMNLQRLQAEYKQFIEEEKAKGAKEISEQDYEEQFVTLSKWANGRYSLNDTTVSQYVALINRFNAENKPKP